LSIEHIAKLFDHVTGGYVWAHNLVTLHYSDDGTDYPVEFQLWQPVAWSGMPRASHAFAAIAGRLKCITKKARPKGWISINYGASAPFNDMSLWLPWRIACCGPPNKTLTFTNNFSVNSRLNLRVLQLPGGAPRKRRACGVSDCSSAPGWRRA
jgi:hypothetical protein